MNKKLLKARIKAATGSNAMLSILSNLLHISERSVWNKTNDQREFKPGEIEKIRIEYELSDSDVVDIFIKDADKKEEKSESNEC